MTKKKYTQPSMLNREELSQNYTGCNIGQILRQRRTELGYTQRDIAWQCKLYEIEVSKLEHSPRVPPENLKSHAHLKSICGTLGLPYSDLMELLKDDVTPRRDTYQEKSRQPADTFEKYWHLTVPLIFKQRRIDLKYTWEDVAEKTGLNLSEVKEYESVTNQKCPPPEILAQLCSALQLSQKDMAGKIASEKTDSTMRRLALDAQDLSDVVLPSDETHIPSSVPITPTIYNRMMRVFQIIHRYKILSELVDAHGKESAIWSSENIFFGANKVLYTSPIFVPLPSLAEKGAAYIRGMVYEMTRQIDKGKHETHYSAAIDFFAPILLYFDCFSQFPTRKVCETVEEAFENLEGLIAEYVFPKKE